MRVIYPYHYHCVTRYSLALCEYPPAKSALHLQKPSLSTWHVLQLQESLPITGAYSTVTNELRGTVRGLFLQYSIDRFRLGNRSCYRQVSTCKMRSTWCVLLLYKYVHHIRSLEKLISFFPPLSSSNFLI